MREKARSKKFIKKGATVAHVAKANNAQSSLRWKAMYLFLSKMPIYDCACVYTKLLYECKYPSSV